jgi:hypothetical protein
MMGAIKSESLGVFVGIRTYGFLGFSRGVDLKSVLGFRIVSEELPMNSGKTLLGQLMDFLPWSTFTRIVARYGGYQRVRTLRLRRCQPDLVCVRTPADDFDYRLQSTLKNDILG